MSQTQTDRIGAASRALPLPPALHLLLLLRQMRRCLGREPRRPQGSGGGQIATPREAENKGDKCIGGQVVHQRAQEARQSWVWVEGRGTGGTRETKGRQKKGEHEPGDEIRVREKEGK